MKFGFELQGKVRVQIRIQPLQKCGTGLMVLIKYGMECLMSPLSDSYIQQGIYLLDYFFLK